MLLPRGGCPERRDTLEPFGAVSSDAQALQAVDVMILIQGARSWGPAGHRIRLQISSSNSPKLASNLNTSLSNTDSAQVIVADQAILHAASNPSRLLLPVLDADGLR